MKVRWPGLGAAHIQHHAGPRDAARPEVAQRSGRPAQFQAYRADGLGTDLQVVRDVPVFQLRGRNGVELRFGGHQNAQMVNAMESESIFQPKLPTTRPPIHLSARIMAGSTSPETYFGGDRDGD